MSTRDLTEATDPPSTAADAFLESVVSEAVKRIEGRVKLVSAERLCERLGISRRSLKTLREHGLPARKVGRFLFFDVAEVDRWISQQ